MTPARRRLAAQAAAAGYPSGTLALIAQAALPGHRPGEQLDELLVDHVRTAVEILAQAGHRGDALGATSRPLPPPLRRGLARALLATPTAPRRPALQPPRALRPLAVRVRRRPAPHAACRAPGGRAA